MLTAWQNQSCSYCYDMGENKEASLDCLEIEHLIESLRADSMKKCSTAYQAVKCELAECNGVLLRGNSVMGHAI